jgi:hypothetical protein
LAISVVLKEGISKELLIEFPSKEVLFDAPPSRDIFIRRLGSCIEAGLSAGYPIRRSSRSAVWPEILPKSNIHFPLAGC